MIDMNEVNYEISTLEKEDLTYRVAEKLAVLYMIRNNNEVDNEPSVRMMAQEEGEESDFRTMCKCIDFEKMLDILDEHMEAIKTVFPKEYDLILRKLENVK